MAKRVELKDEVVDTVTGGVAFFNSFGNYQTVCLRRTNGTYEYTFDLSKMNEVLDVITATKDPNLSDDVNDANIISALQGKDLLTPISSDTYNQAMEAYKKYFPNG